VTADTQTAQVYAQVRAAILSLALAPGERLTERGLERRFAASRTPARAALVRLEAEGLVQRDGRGWCVAPIDTAEIQAVGELREAVEGATVRLAVVRATDADIADVRALLDSAQPRDEATTLRAGRDFHVELARLGGNPLMADIVAGAMTRLARTRWLEVRTPEARAQAWQDHRAIVDAVSRRDATGAAELVAAHIRGTHERLLHHLRTAAPVRIVVR
jgi:DNA-binding GntR family transcriptional regulator